MKVIENRVLKQFVIFQTLKIRSVFTRQTFSESVDSWSFTKKKRDREKKKTRSSLVWSRFFFFISLESLRLAFLGFIICFFGGLIEIKAIFILITLLIARPLENQAGHIFVRITLVITVTNV